MKYRVAALCAVLWGSAAQASDTPLYQPAPGWAQAVDVAKLAKDGPLVAVYEDQTRIDGAKVLAYEERAWRLNDPSTLTRFGTVTLNWRPDYGDLVIHKLELIRDGRTIDVLADSKFTVLRRETSLEQRVMSGALTATLAVPAIQVGDILHLAYGRVETDAALGGHVQSLSTIPVATETPERGRVVTTWPAGQKVAWRALPERSLPSVRTSAGWSTFELALPVEKAKPVPDDAPARYRASPLVMFADFADWADVSRTFAPLFARASAIPADGPLAAEVARIRAATPDKPAQMLAALQLVQDKIGYLLNGMNGGNYSPQSAAQTWEARYGDCKAKSALLLGILGALDIRAEGLLVNAQVPDLPAATLPAPIAFDHVIVRAHLGGREFFLDGTVGGANLANLGDSPGFRWGLPVTAAGATLVALPAGVSSAPTALTTTRIDLRAGPDFSNPVDARIVLLGPVVRQLRVFEQVPPGRQRDDALDLMFGKLFGEVTMIDRAMTFDTAAGTATLTGQFVENSRWTEDGKRWSYAPVVPGHPVPFKPDRSRAAWVAIPVELGSPERTRVTAMIQLPDEGRGVTIDGGVMHFASRRATIERSTTQAAGTATVVEDIVSAGGELAPADIAAERVKSVAMEAATIKLRLPVDTLRSWQLKDAAGRARLAPLLAAYTRLIAARPDEANGSMQRGYVYQQLGRYDLARADFDKAITLEASADNYDYRAYLREIDGDLPGGAADRRQAYDLDPTAERLNALANTLERTARASEALTMIDSALESASDNRPYLVRTKALALGWLGRSQEGLDLLEEQLSDRPGDADALDVTCFYRGLYKAGLDAAAAECDKAVTRANYSASALHSRAVVNLRLGKREVARTDIDAALELAPGNEEYLLARGIIRLAQGDNVGARADIAEAERRNRTVGAVYRAVGLLH